MLQISYSHNIPHTNTNTSSLCHAVIQLRPVENLKLVSNFKYQTRLFECTVNMYIEFLPVFPVYILSIFYVETKWWWHMSWQCTMSVTLLLMQCPGPEYAHLYQARSFTTIWPAQAEPWVPRTSWKLRFLASFTPTRLINKIGLFLLTISPPPLLNENCLDNDYKTCQHPTWYEFLGTPLVRYFMEGYW